MIIITGASDGLGLELAKLFSEEGKIIINVSRRECPQAQFNVLTDLSDLESVKAAAEKISKIPGELEVLINCAGVFSSQNLGTISIKELQQVLSVNVESAIVLVSHLIERIKADRTDIINVSSTAGIRSSVGQASYSASKWAMRGFSTNLQIELKDTNRVISFIPGGMNTRLFEKAVGKDVFKNDEWMDPADVARFIKQILELPKNMEVTEIVLNRK